MLRKVTVTSALESTHPRGTQGSTHRGDPLPFGTGSQLAGVSLGAVPEVLAEARTINRCRRKRQGPNSSDTRGMGPNKDRRDSHGSIRQAHLPDAQNEGGAGPTTESDTHCKRD